jgi:hypothetical protein
MPLPKFNPDMEANDADALIRQAREASDLSEGACRMKRGC